MLSHAIEILLVEDNPNDAELTIRALRKSNLANRVCHVKDGEEALDYLFGRGSYAGRDLQEVPRVVLLDLKLPKVDGIEVLRRLKSDGKMRRTPVVVLTSSREDRDLDECYRLGANSYIIKPVEFDSFIRAVSELSLYWLILNEPPRC
jgi:two-component system, response regulator